MEVRDLRRDEEKERDRKLLAFLDQEFPGLVTFNRLGYNRRQYTSSSFVAEATYHRVKMKF